MRVCTHRFTCRIVCVEHRSLARLCPLRRHILEKPCLRPRIVLHRLVIVEVILRQVREYRRIELNARNAPLIECVRGDLHHDRIHPACTHFGQQLLHDNDIGGRVRRREHLVLHHDLYRPDEPHAFPRMAQDCTHEIACRRLSVRPRNPNDAHCACGIVVEIRHNDIQSLLEIRHMENGDTVRDIHRLPLRQNGASSRPRRIRYKAVCIHMSTADADKERPLLHAARVSLNARNLGIAARNPCILQERGKL